jgi:hypothetical protein
MDLEDIGWESALRNCDSAYDPVACCFESGNETLGYIRVKDGKFI